LAHLQLTEIEAEYLAGIPGLTEEYINWLTEFSFKPDTQVELTSTEPLKGKFRVDITIKGYWADVMLYEVTLFLESNNSGLT
jgi:nicotinate phosphoribosyltransferase